MSQSEDQQQELTVVQSKHFRYMQYISVLFGSLPVAAGAMYTAWPSPALSKLHSADSPLGREITDREGSWVASSYLLSSSIFSIFGGCAIDTLGRKNTLLYSSLTNAIPWFIIAFGHDIEVIYIARVLAGSGAGLGILAAAVYSAEVAEEDIRGKLAIISVGSKIIGSLYTLSIGPYISYQALALTSSIEPIIALVLIYFMPESPYFNVEAGEIKAAEKNLRRLSRKGATNSFIKRRMNLIENTVEGDMQKKATIWEFITNKDYRKAIVLMAGIKTTQQLSGFSAVEAYMQRIIELSKSTISPELSSVIFGCIQLPAVVLSSLLVDKVGRRPLLLLSALGSAVALIGEGLYFFIQDALQGDTSSITWLPTTSITLYLLMQPLGLSTLPYLFIGEFFPTNIKGTAAAVATIYGGMLSFLVTNLFKPLTNIFGAYSMFWFFATICILGAIFVFFKLPETRGKNFSDIQAIFTGQQTPINKTHPRYT